MKIGYACTPLMISNKTTRKLTLATYSEEKVIELIKSNLDDLLAILIYNNSKGIKLFRISSDIIPLGSHEINTIEWWDIFKPLLSKIGEYITQNNLRVSMHPGQYTLLNSPNEDVVKKSIADLTYHCRFLDSLNINSSHKIILHVGGCYNDKPAAIERFITVFNSLETSLKNRLVIENDERFFSIHDLLYINTQTNIPLIFDNLHYDCYEEIKYSLEELLTKVNATWTDKDGSMKIHYSEQDITKKSGAHAPTIFINTFKDFISKYDFNNIDIMLEVKDKDISAIKVINSLNNQSNSSYIMAEVQKYELFILEKGGEGSLETLLSFLNKSNIDLLYNFIDTFIYKPYNEDYFVFALNKAFALIKDELNSKEINHYNKNYNEEKYIRCKEYLKKLSDKYDFSLNHTYYFIY